MLRWRSFLGGSEQATTKTSCAIGLQISLVDTSQFNLLTVPTAAFRSGDLSGGSTTIYDPNTGAPDGSGRTPFVTNGMANVIPADRLSPTALKLLALVPLPNVPGATFSNNYQATTVFQNDVNAFDAKIDQQLRGTD